MSASYLPDFLYGTAWKEDETERLTTLALESGFRAIDTANQRKHYNEAGVGAAVAAFLAAGRVTRQELFIQTKFTSLSGQDERLPYDKHASPTQQVEQSFARSLEHLQLDSIDSYILHGPSQRIGLSEFDLEIWRAMESLHQAGKTRFLGVSNVGLDQLETLCERARITPKFVQNRCYANRGWDVEIRSFCSAHGIVYQGFSLLTANQPALRSVKMRKLAHELDRTPAQLVFRFAIQSGMLPLTGTTDPDHMREDLRSRDFVISEEQLSIIAQLT